MSAIVPVPRVEIAIRLATMADIPFMDGLQKKHSKALGYFPTQQFEGYVQSGGVLIAEEKRSTDYTDYTDCREEKNESVKSVQSVDSSSLPLGYVISRDRYLKRDELGVIYQLCVSPGVQRKLVGAMMVREVFARSAYGCRLYCCWCAQDLEANYFWESMGFLPVAFRAGSSGKRRVHIFWQKRIVEGDTTTPIWFPSLTNQGAIREDRLVFPIPPGTHWSEVKAVELNQKKELPSAEGESPATPTAPPKPRMPARQPIRLGPPPLQSLAEAEIVRPMMGKPKRPKKPKVAIDPKHRAAARELRDKYLERFNQADAAMLPQGKYDVCRLVPPDAPEKRLITSEAA